VVADPLEGYEIVPMQWKGVIKEGEAPISLNGTIEVRHLLALLAVCNYTNTKYQSVISQIKELNPEFELVEEETDASSGLEARNPVRYILIGILFSNKF
jgi:hypothetical protein